MESIHLEKHKVWSLKRYATEKHTTLCNQVAFYLEKPTFPDKATLGFNLVDQFIQASGPELNWISAHSDYKQKTLVAFFFFHAMPDPLQVSNEEALV